MTMATKGIVLPLGCKPSLACSEVPSRPKLSHGYVLPREDGLWLCATDSYIAVALKVEGDAEEGWVPFDALRLMEEASSLGMTAHGVQMSTTAWKVPTLTGYATFEIDDPGKFPDLQVLDMWDPLEGAGSVSAIGLNPDLTVRVANALGCGASNGLRMEFVGRELPVRVCHDHHRVERRGLQMPVRLQPDMSPAVRAQRDPA